MHSLERLMTHPPLVTLRPQAKVAQALRLIADHAVSHLLIVENERLFGVVCACDLEHVDTGDSVGACVRAPEPFTVDVSASAVDAARCMLELGISCLPVTRQGVVIGIVTRSDLRNAGLFDRAGGSCASCGSRDHVRCAHGVHDTGFCLECARRSEPPGWDEDVGGG